MKTKSPDKSKVIKIALLTLLIFSNSLSSQNTRDNSLEAYKFDALSNSNMVDLLTGDLNYQLPVLTIPGPEGGYTINLNYNAGIHMEDDASWVGLGWSLSPGSVMRSINGAPDDLQNYTINQETHAIRHYTSPITSHVLFGQSWLSLAWIETNSKYTKWDWDHTAFMMAYGPNETKRMAGTVLGSIENNLNRNIASSGHARAIGAGSSGGNTGYFVGSQLNNTSTYLAAAQVVWDQNGFFSDVSHTETDFELFGDVKKYTSGAIYLGDARHTDAEHGGETWGRQSYSYMMDMYTNKTDTRFNNNLSFPAYDVYSVRASGLSGNMQPVTLADGALLGEGYAKNDECFQYMLESGVSSELFSAGGQNNTNFNPNTNLSFIFRGQHPNSRKKIGSFDLNTTTGTATAEAGNIEVSEALCSGKIVGGKHVETVFGPDHNITGFKITDEDGTTYNFTYPVYQLERVSRTFDSNNPNDYSEQRMFNAYVYSWLLTSIVGADYVDKGTLNTVDDADEGYWVKFNYAKWSDGYVWKTPYDKNEKRVAEERADISTYEWGIKQLAYLNSIETRTHKAYFIKFLRDDGLGSDFSENTPININGRASLQLREPFYGCKRETKRYKDTDNGCNSTGTDCPGVAPEGWYEDVNTITIVDNCCVADFYQFTPQNLAEGTSVSIGPGKISDVVLTNSGKQRTLGLKKIILVRKNDPTVPVLSPASFDYTANGISATDKVQYTKKTYFHDVEYGFRILMEDCGLDETHYSETPYTREYTDFNQTRTKYYGNLVYDIYDLATSSIESSALQVVDFDYDYSLCGNAPNSLPVTTGSSTNKGKLTLKSVSLKDWGGSDLEPPTKFTYTLPATTFDQTNLGTTSNPQWLKMQDDWGYRVTTNASLKQVVNKDQQPKDLAAAWSLAQIETPTGGKIKINYESDTYIREAATKQSFDTQIKSVKANDASYCRYTMTLPLNPSGTTPSFTVGSSYSISLTGVKSFLYPSAAAHNRTLTGKYLSYSPGIGGYMAKFEIIAGWDSDDDFSALTSSGVVDQSSNTYNFTSVNTRNECNGITVKYLDGVNVSTAFITGHEYDIKIYGSNISTWAGSMYNATTPLVVTGATVYSINVATNEVVFLLDSYDLNYTGTVTPDTYSYSTGETGGREFNGGGLRVAELIMEDENGKQLKTVYEYKNGVTSYAPGNILQKNIDYMAELPAPGVIYGNVTEKNVGDNGLVNSITEYEYETMESNAEGQELAYGDQLYIENGDIENTGVLDIGADHVTFHTRAGTIHNNTGKIGRINKIIHKSKDGTILAFSKYNYTPKDACLSGIAQESFHERKRRVFFVGSNYISDWYLTSSSRVFYPTELASVENHKNNLTAYIKYGSADMPYNGFDVYTHKPLIVENKKPSGELARTKSVMAYTVYPEMFSKTCSSTNKNIMNATVEQLDYIVNDAGEEKILGAVAQTYSKYWDYRRYNNITGIYENVNEAGAYRLDKTYSWRSLLNADGTVVDFTDYDWSAGALNNGWEKTSASVLFSPFSKGLELKDVNDKYSAAKFGYKNSFMLAAAKNAKYGAFAFSGAEDVADGNYMGGEVKGVSKRFLHPVFAHTGKYCLKLNAAETGFNYSGSVGTSGTEDFKQGQTIRANLWLHKINAANGRLEYFVYASDGTTVLASGYVDKASTSTKAIGANWFLLTLDFTIPSGTGAARLLVQAANSGTSSVYVDDFKVHPVESIVTGNVYDDKTGWITATLDEDNFATRYYYDTAGRLIRVDKETMQGWKKVNENSYHYGRP